MQAEPHTPFCEQGERQGMGSPRGRTPSGAGRETTPFGQKERPPHNARAFQHADHTVISRVDLTHAERDRRGGLLNFAVLPQLIAGQINIIVP